MAENFVEEENLGISSDQQKEKVDSPIHCLNLGASNIIRVGGTTYLSGLEGLDNWIAINLFIHDAKARDCRGGNVEVACGNEWGCVEVSIAAE